MTDTGTPSSIYGISTMNISTSAPKMRRTPKRLTVRAWATLPEGQRLLAVQGQEAKCLLAAVEAGQKGITALEVSAWALRLSAYVHTLQKNHGLVFTMEREDHEGGWHGRYRLACPVEIVETIRPEGRA